MKEHHASVKVCFLLGVAAVAETAFVLLTAYKYARFRNGPLSLEDQPCSGCLSTSWMNENTRRIHKVNLEDCHQTIDELVDWPGPPANGFWRSANEEELQQNLSLACSKSSPDWRSTGKLAWIYFLLKVITDKENGLLRDLQMWKKGIKRHHFTRFPGLLWIVENLHCFKWRILSKR